MAIKATVYKANLHIADMQRHYYQDHSLTLAQHPSETHERLMVRLLAFILHACDDLEFGQGMTDDDEADLWVKDLTGALRLWIDVGLPDEKLVRKACGRSGRVVVYTYGGRTADMWFTHNNKLFARQNNLTIINLPSDQTQALSRLVQRTMDLQCSIQDDSIWISDGADSVQIDRVYLINPD